MTNPYAKLTRYYLFLVAWGLIATAPASLLGDDFYLQNGQRVIFFGDSITQSGKYINYIEAYLRTRFPDQQFELINHGISSETISGTSESDHTPRRPHALPRFTRDVAAWKPDVLVSCFGMNDGNYHPPDEQRFQKYQVGIRSLITRTKNTGAKLVLLTPPPFDPYRRRASDQQAKEYGYKFAAINYDQTLTGYSRWLLSLEKENQFVVDLHGSMNHHLRRRRQDQVSFFFSPDSVHPNETGHWLMAQAVLLAWKAPTEVAVARINASGGKVLRGEITQFNTDGNGISFSWSSRLPMPMDKKWDRESLQLEKVTQRLNKFQLQVLAAKSKRYVLAIDEIKLAEVTREELASGIDLTRYPQLSANRRSMEVLKLVSRRQALIYNDWRKRIQAGENGQDSMKLAQARQLDTRLRELCQPLVMKVQLTPIGQ